MDTALFHFHENYIDPDYLVGGRRWAAQRGAPALVMDNPELIERIEKEKNRATNITRLLEGHYTLTAQGFVSVKDAMFRAVGNGEANDREAIQAALYYAEEKGLGVFLPPGIYACEGPLDHPSGVHIRGAGRGVSIIERNFADSGDQNFLLTQSDLAEIREGGSLSHITLRGRGTLATGGGLHFWKRRNFIVAYCGFLDFNQPEGGGSGQACVYAAYQSSIVHSRAIASDLGLTQTGTGAFRCFGCEDFTGAHLYAHAGDDLFQFVPATGPNSQNYDLSCINGTYAHCRGISTKARVMVIGQGGNQSGTAEFLQMHGQVFNCGYIDVHGASYQGRGIQIRQTRSSALMDNLFFISCTIDKSDDTGSGLSGAQAINITTDRTNSGNADPDELLDIGGFGRIVFTDLTIKDNANLQALRYNNAVPANTEARVILDKCDFSAGGTGIQFLGFGLLAIRDGVLRLTGETNGLLLSEDQAGQVGRLELDGMEVAGVRSNFAAVRLAACESARITNLKPVKAAGASNTTGVSRVTNGAADNVVVTDIKTGGVDVLLSGIDDGLAWRQAFATQGGAEIEQNGAVTMAQGVTQASVSFPVEMADASYRVVGLTTNRPEPVWWGGRASTGFNVNRSDASDATTQVVHWHVRGLSGS